MPTNGLGYNVFRYNIGGGENPTHTHMGQCKDMPGFEPSSGTWDWTADANQRAILQRIVASGGSGVILEAFSNSPPYWMTKQRLRLGQHRRLSNNLQGRLVRRLRRLPDRGRQALPRHLGHHLPHARAAQRAERQLVDGATAARRAATSRRANQQTIIKAVAASLTAKGLTGTTVSASDENSIDDGYNIMRGFDATTLAGMSQMNVHSYSGSMRANLRTLATSNGKRLWESESGPLNQTLADDTDAARVHGGADHRPTCATCRPRPGSTGRSAIPAATGPASRSTTRSSRSASCKRFYMHAGFSRYIRPGATFVDVNNADMVAAVSPDGSRWRSSCATASTTASAGFTFDLTVAADGRRRRRGPPDVAHGEPGRR